MMGLPEDVQQLCVRDDGGIVDDLDGLGVIPQVMIRGVWFGAARVSYPGADNAMEGPEPGIRTPESPQGKGGGLGMGRDGIPRRDQGTGSRLSRLQA
jgi:hypothetical protein